MEARSEVRAQGNRRTARVVAERRKWGVRGGLEEENLSARCPTRGNGGMQTRPEQGSWTVDVGGEVRAQAAAQTSLGRAPRARLSLTSSNYGLSAEKGS